MTHQVKSVLLLDGVDPVCGQLLAKAGIQVTTKGKLTKDELLKEIKEYDGVIIRSATKVTDEVLQAGARLRIIGRAGVGVDNVDVDAATRRGVIVMNTPSGNTLSAAEQTCALICSLSRSIPQACTSLKEGKWDRKAFMGTELYGKTLAIIGLGRIGREVAKRMQSFGMTTIGYDPMVPANVSAEWGVESLSLEDIWPRADYITVHTPLLPHTKNLIGEAVFKVCKKGVYVVNVARGGIVDEAALLAALQSGVCGGAALDVFVQEPPTDFTLCKHPKVICTPHLGANTVEAQRRVAVEIAEQIVDMVNGKTLVGVINAPALTNSTSEICKPWIELGKALGHLGSRLSQPTDASSLALSIELFGSEVSGMKTFLGSAILVGLLKGMTQAGVNMVNAPGVAQDMGIKISVEAHPNKQPSVSSAAPDALQLKITTGSKDHTLLGNCAGGQPTLHVLDGCVWESGLPLGRNMLFFSASPTASPLAAIATQLVGLRAPLTSILSSAPTQKEVWHVARTTVAVDNTLVIPDAKLVAQVTF
ncbi:D-3-phosphoglycerate dehydrogenase [Palaemon carinicauda]|uniref:D-3-phosphoglycerate dehydrogenase n=1 Tax=Palaemon carinicauda TaxID=392227 RepID=UPI0035B5E42E